MWTHPKQQASCESQSASLGPSIFRGETRGDGSSLLYPFPTTALSDFVCKNSFEEIVPPVLAMLMIVQKREGLVQAKQGGISYQWDSWSPSALCLLHAFAHLFKNLFFSSFLREPAGDILPKGPGDQQLSSLAHLEEGFPGGPKELILLGTPGKGQPAVTVVSRDNVRPQRNEDFSGSQIPFGLQLLLILQIPNPIILASVPKTYLLAI